MPTRTPKVLLENIMFPEGPRWHKDRLWFSDMYAHEVVAVDMQGKREVICRVEQQPSGLGWLPDGRALIVSMLDRRLLRLEKPGMLARLMGRNGSVKLTQVADLKAITGGECNDMVVDSKGRAYVGNLGFDVHGGAPDKPGNIVMVTPDGKTRIVADNLMIPNGTVVTPDGKTMIVGESRGKRLTAFDIQPDGSLTNRRVWAQLEVVPDGICLDAEGCIWVGAPSQNTAYYRVAQGGKIKEKIESDGWMAIACMLGGPSGKTLFMLDVKTGQKSAIKDRTNGRIRTVEVDVPRAGLP
ncbi:MAG: SMP-30/gluconolactonase/LRE family protein [Chloroflexi bacterium]|nr:SMP-30/gluconolactonase/LRE family protein [Chloroflexota bacterium]